MIIVDTNLLVYAVNPTGERDEVVRRWLEARLSGPERVGLPWVSLLGLVRIGTNPRIFPRPIELHDAWGTVRGWLTLPHVWTPEPTAAHADILDGLMSSATRSEHVTDAHLAALAIEHGLVLCSADRGFARFDGLRWTNPIES